MNLPRKIDFTFEPGRGITAAQLNEMINTINATVDAINFIAAGSFDVNQETQSNNAFKLEQAINAIPENRRKLGMKVRFKKKDNDEDSSNNLYVEYSYMGSTLDAIEFLTVGNWTSGVDYIDGGEF